MKIEKKEKKFEPVTITLETQDELDFFTCLLYRTNGELIEEIKKKNGVYPFEQLVEAGGYLGAFYSQLSSSGTLCLKEVEPEF